MHGDETPYAYLNRAQEYADALATIGEPVKDKNLVMLVISGLREEYNRLKTTITTRQSPTTFSELHALLSDHDYMLKKLASTQNTVYGTCNRCGIGHIPSQCPNRNPSTIRTRPSANFANTRAQSSNASANWNSDTGANSHVTPDLEAMDNSEAYYGDDALHIGNDESTHTTLLTGPSKHGLYTITLPQLKSINKNVQTDWGGEFRNLASFFSSLGIIHRRSCPHTSEQNGFVERRNRHVVETGLTLLAQACVPQRFWHYDFDTAVYLINRMPSRTSTNKSPFEHIFKRSPDYSFLRVFGCLYFPRLRPYNRHKMDFRFTPCVFLGYSPSYYGYPCLDISTERLYIARHVHFNEAQFPFDIPKTTSPPPLKTSPYYSLESPYVIPTTDHSSPSSPRSPISSPSSVSHLSPTSQTSPESSNGQPSPVSTTSIPTPPPPPPSITRKRPANLRQNPKQRCQAMKEEYDALMKTGTWSLVPRASTTNVVDGKWVYRLKRDKNGAINRYKARFVAKGCRQQPDIQNAFLHGNLKERVYVKQPPGFIDPQRPNHVCLLHKSLYGLNQAPRGWFERLSKALFDLGNNKGTIDNIICQLGSAFALKDLGSLNYFLGIEIIQDNLKALKELETLHNKHTKKQELKSIMETERSQGSLLTAILQAKTTNSIQGIYGRMGDLGAIDAKYDVAILTVVGGLDYIVVETSVAAQACVDMLCKNNLGVATFMIMVQDERMKFAFYAAMRNTVVANDIDQVDAPPDIIDVVDQDDDITDDEDALPHDLADSDDEDLINVDDDGVDKMSADVARSHGGDGGGEDRPPPHHVPTGCMGCFANRGKGKRKPNLGGRAAGRLNTRDKTRNLSLKEITDKKGPVPIRFELRDKQTLMPLGDHAAHWSSYIGEVIRGVPLYYPSWLKVPKERKAALITDIGHLQKAYNTNKAAFKAQHWVIDPTTGTYDVDKIRWARPGDIMAEEWDKYIKFWNDPRNIARAAQNRQSSATQEYPSLIDTFFTTHTVNKEFLQDEDRRIYEMRRLEAMGTYTDDEINHLARGPAQQPTQKVDFMMSLFKSDSKYSDMFSQFESGGASESGRCGDDEENADEEEEDGDSDS
ncbi:retrovirus-related pol polyprotein from transposon TNT 1-94 [Tanacetum coccineum]